VAISVDEAISSNERNNISDITPGDSVEIIANNTCKNHIKTLRDCLAITDIAAMEKAVEHMVKAKRVDFYGVGSSGLVALDAQNKFLRINKTSMSALDPHLQMLYSSTLTKDDVVVLISYTGETKDILNTLNIVKELGVTSIAITRYGGNSLSENADIALTTISNETFMRSGAMTSRIGQLYLIDVLYTSVASKMYDEVKEHLRLTANYSKKTKKKIH
jgi:DNA-binding MurR/RpiR family transcriptional regulator